MTDKGRFAIAYLFAVLASVFLLETGIGLFVFAVPLLVVSERIQDKKSAIAIFGFAFLAQICLKCYDYWGLVNISSVGVVIMDCIFPLMVLAEGAIFISMRDRTDSFLRRLVLSSHVTVVLGLACGLYLSSQSGAPVLEGLSKTLEITLSYFEDSLGIDISRIIPYMLGILLYAPVPVGMLLAGLQIWIASNLLNKNNQDWQMGFAHMKMPNWYSWLFIVFWALAALVANVSLAPQFLSVIVWNSALGISIHYFMNGVSILTAKLRRHSAVLTAGRICFIIVLLAVIPVVNAAMFVGLTLLGVLETWIEMR